MKKLILITCLCMATWSASALAFSVPSKPLTYVNDYTSTLKKTEVQSLEEKLQAYEKESSNEIAVVIITSLDGDTIENVANELFNTWGIGKKANDNGALLLIALADRKTRIEVGYGLEPTLT